jgi:hypothetical protein
MFLQFKKNQISELPRYSKGPLFTVSGITLTQQFERNKSVNIGNVFFFQEENLYKMEALFTIFVLISIQDGGSIKY